MSAVSSGGSPIWAINPDYQSGVHNGTNPGTPTAGFFHQISQTGPQTSSVVLFKGNLSSVIFECSLIAGATGQISVTVLDGWASNPTTPSIDTQAVQNIINPTNGYFAFQCSVLLPFVTVLINITSGTWRILGTAMDIPNGSTIDPSVQAITYSAAGVIAPATNATDVAGIIGSNDCVTRITYLGGTGFAAAADNVNVLIIKRKTLNTGAPAGTVPFAAHDSLDPATANSTLVYWNSTSGNPGALGTAVGTYRAAATLVPATGAQVFPVKYSFGVRPAKPIVLRSANEGLYVNLDASSPAGATLAIESEITEGPS